MHKFWDFEAQITKIEHKFFDPCLTPLFHFEETRNGAEHCCSSFFRPTPQRSILFAGYNQNLIVCYSPNRKSYLSKWRGGLGGGEGLPGLKTQFESCKNFDSGENGWRGRRRAKTVCAFWSWPNIHQFPLYVCPNAYNPSLAFMTNLT